MRNELILEQPIRRKRRENRREEAPRPKHRQEEQPRYQMYDFRGTERELSTDPWREHLPNHNSQPPTTFPPPPPTDFNPSYAIDTQQTIHPYGACIQQQEPVQNLYTQTVEAEVREIRRYLKQLMSRLQQKEERSKIMLEWKIVALVLDRLFFFFYLVTCIVSLMLIFPRNGE